jgi:hypothetical protein
MVAAVAADEAAVVFMAAVEVAREAAEVFRAVAAVAPDHRSTARRRSALQGRRHGLEAALRSRA